MSNIAGLSPNRITKCINGLIETAMIAMNIGNSSTTDHTIIEFETGKMIFS